MPAGSLLAVYAYQVAPGQAASFVGGAARPNTELQAALDFTFDYSKISGAPSVTFAFDAASRLRTHPIRDAALALAFADDRTADQTSIVRSLAARLAAAMDLRSKPSLLMVSVHEAPAKKERRLLLWTFPQQQVFNLRLGDNEVADLELLKAFSRESNLRKAALLEGPHTKNGMLTARVLDFQASASERAAADLWIVKFLDARLQMSDVEGTRLLARALRAAHHKSRDDHQAQAQIAAAIVGLRVAGERRWTIEHIASTYLGSAAAEAVTASVRPEERRAVFGIDVDRLDQLVQFRRFVLDSDVVVSVPFGLADEDRGVEIFEQDGMRRLRVQGTIREELVRSHA